MDKKDLFTAGIFLISFLSLLLVSFGAMLNPIKKDIIRLETNITRVETDLKADTREIRNKLDTLILTLSQNKPGAGKNKQANLSR